MYIFSVYYSIASLSIREYLTCDVKVLAIIPNSVRLHCQLVNQPNFFLLQRAMSELEMLCQTYFSRTNLKRRKIQKQNTSKKVRATLPSSHVIFYFLLFVYIRRKMKKNTVNDHFCSIKNALSNGVLKFKFIFAFYIKIELF